MQQTPALTEWLQHVPRVPSPYRFATSDVIEQWHGDDSISRLLGQMVARTKTDPAVLERMAHAVGWADALSRLRRSRLLGLRRGDVGEVLATEVIEAFEGYRVPIRKLRYQTDPEQALHGTDVVGFEVTSDGKVEALHFLECKLRTYRDLAAAVDAHTQLASDRLSGFADTLMFLADRLAETDPEFLQSYLDYLGERTRSERGTYGICLIWEAGLWDEDVLARLDELATLVSPLHARTIRVSDLAQLVEQAYAHIGVEVIDDGT
jgi:hypothetical protein